MNEDHLRGTGRTKRMVLGLPATGSIVIVHNGPMLAYIDKMIRDLRGVAVAQRTTIAVANDAFRVERILAGRDVPVFIDHAFYSAVKGEVAIRVMDLVEHANYRAANVTTESKPE